MFVDEHGCAPMREQRPRGPSAGTCAPPQNRPHAGSAGSPYFRALRRLGGSVAAGRCANSALHRGAEALVPPCGHSSRPIRPALVDQVTPQPRHTMAATNKCLARSNKSRTAAKATNEPGRPWLSNLSTYRPSFGDGAPPPTSASSPEPSNESISDNIMVMFPNKAWSRRRRPPCRP
jgi:hypothetical protein